MEVLLMSIALQWLCFSGNTVQVGEPGPWEVWAHLGLVRLECAGDGTAV